MVSCLLLAVAVLVLPSSTSRLPVAAAWRLAEPPGRRARFEVAHPGGSGVRHGVGGVRGHDRVVDSAAVAGPRAAPRGLRKWLLLLACGLLAPVFLIAGPAGVAAAALVIVTGDRLIRQALADRQGRADLVDVVAALRMFGRELRSGAEPGPAAARVTAAAHGAGARTLDALTKLIMVGERAGGGEVTALTAPARTAPGPYALSRLIGGWRLTARYGIAMAPIVDDLAGELTEQLAADAGRAGQLAGPRTSGYVLAALPILGLMLGTGMGAAPVRVLLHTPIGNILLVSGVTLTCVGLLWSARIVRR